jgi:hypothetical protein
MTLKHLLFSGYAANMDTVSEKVFRISGLDESMGEKIECYA